MGTDSKYGRVTAEKKEIPEGEPVFLLRAQDRLAAQAVRHYARLRQKAGDEKGAKECRRIAQAMSDWPKKKMPD